MLTANGHCLRFPARIGLGTWGIGSSSAERARDVSAVTHALEIGYRVFDTAELYGDGGAERVLGSALKSFGMGRRSDLFIVSKGSATSTSMTCDAGFGPKRALA